MANEATLFEHEDGRHAVGTGSPAFTIGDPAWHRVGPVDVSALTAPVATEQAQAVAEGWKLVPVQPTEEMLRAGLDYGAYGRDNIHSWDDPQAVYLAMLAASPEGAPVAMAQFIEPVMTMHRGGSDAFGRTNVAVRWEAGANKLPDGEHKLYARAETGAETPAHELAFVQPVPSHCDRITWRGSYYHLPISASPEAAPAAMVTDEQLIRAAYQHLNTWDEDHTRFARAVLALAQPAPVQEASVNVGGGGFLENTNYPNGVPISQVPKIAAPVQPNELTLTTTIADLAQLTGRKMLDLMTEAARCGITVTANQPFDALPLLGVLAAPVQAGAQQAVKNQCSLCGGRGFYGTPGARCEWCRGTGKDLAAPAPSMAGDAK